MSELHRDLPTQAGGLGDAGLPADASHEVSHV
jgi:hypothetical protein